MANGEDRGQDLTPLRLITNQARCRMACPFYETLLEEMVSYRQDNVSSSNILR